MVRPTFNKEPLIISYMTRSGEERMKSRGEPLEEKGLQLLSENDFQGAEILFAKALSIQEKVRSRNYLALAIFMQKDLKRALTILEPNLSLEPSRATPFSYALMAQIQAEGNRVEEASHWLNKAIAMFERRIEDVKNEEEMSATREDTIRLMQAAGSLGQHGQVVHLYRLLKKQTTYYHHYLAGIAYFNLGDYSQAASMWSSVKEMGEAALWMEQVALLVDEGIVPPFTLEYVETSKDQLFRELTESANDERAMFSIVEHGMVRMILLSFLVHPQGDGKKTDYPIETLIIYGGDWGRELGLNILESSVFPTDLKLSAASLLVQCGALPEDAPISMVIDGRETSVKMQKIEISFDNGPEIEEVVAKAKRLDRQGCLSEAIIFLEKYLPEGKFHPKILLVLSNLYRKANELEKALSILQTLEEIYEDEPSILFNLAALWLQKEDMMRARHYFHQLDPRRENQEFKHQYMILKEEIESRERESIIKDVQRIMYPLLEKRRLEIEEKDLPLHPSIKRGLRNMPAKWLDFMVKEYSIQHVRRRKERERVIEEYLSNRINLQTIIQSVLHKEELDLLKDLLTKGGWARFNVITTQYGTMEGDGFFWYNDPPSSSLGRLWSMGLVMVGCSKISGHNIKVVTIPKELRQPLSSLMGLDDEEMTLD